MEKKDSNKKLLDDEQFLSLVLGALFVALWSVGLEWKGEFKILKYLESVLFTGLGVFMLFGVAAGTAGIVSKKEKLWDKISAVLIGLAINVALLGYIMWR